MARSDQIKRIRQETLTLLKMLYPAPLQAKVILRSLLVISPQLEWEDFRKDLAYLQEKGYIARRITEAENLPDGTSVKERWFALTAAGVEIADRCVLDPALEV